jgi:hypothetical protein
MNCARMRIFTLGGVAPLGGAIALGFGFSLVSSYFR